MGPFFPYSADNHGLTDTAVCTRHEAEGISRVKKRQTKKISTKAYTKCQKTFIQTTGKKIREIGQTKQAKQKKKTNKINKNQ